MRRSGSSGSPTHQLQTAHERPHSPTLRFGERRCGDDSTHDLRRSSESLVPCVPQSVNAGWNGYLGFPAESPTPVAVQHFSMESPRGFEPRTYAVRDCAHAWVRPWQLLSINGFRGIERHPATLSDRDMGDGECPYVVVKLPTASRGRRSCGRGSWRTVRRSCGARGR